eukprot:GILK01006006.1.p1 GENE.GILK01006006.1~~GILK01006006.1.p1  ORF type:complete len:460 (-),score=20.49 GILK01006006.1:121-1440(-)
MDSDDDVLAAVVDFVVDTSSSDEEDMPTAKRRRQTLHTRPVPVPEVDYDEDGNQILREVPNNWVRVPPDQSMWMMILRDGGDAEFFRHVRFSKSDFFALAQELRGELTRPRNRYYRNDIMEMASKRSRVRRRIWPEGFEAHFELGVCLMRLAHAFPMFFIGKYVGCATSTVSDVFCHVLSVICNRWKREVEWPDAASRAKLAERVSLKFPAFGAGHVGFIDGCMLYVKRPGDSRTQLPEEIEDALAADEPLDQTDIAASQTGVFVLRPQRSYYSGYAKAHSLRVLLVIGPHGLAQYIATANGATNDQAHWRSTSLAKEHNLYFAPGEKLLADSGYGMSPELLTPFDNDGIKALTLAEKAFNRAHSSVRIAVEWGFGIFSSQWRIFKSYSLSSQWWQWNSIVNAIAILCNIQCKRYGNQVSRYFRVQWSRDEETGKYKWA